jgi:hypothetical protein
MNDDNQQRAEALGPAERIIQALLAHSDHMVHNRPGIVTQKAGSVTGVHWAPVTHKVEGEGDAAQKVVYRLDKVGKKTNKVRIGVMDNEGVIRNGAAVVGRYQKPGLYAEVASWMYRQVADIYLMDNEFAAHWASYAFAQEHRDLKVVLAAFMLVQNRHGEPVRENGEVLFLDEDYREVGEAMLLIRRKDKRDLNPKLLLRIGDLLALPEIAAINRELGFGRSARNPTMGRYTKAVEKWLRQREQNPKMLAGLVKAGFRTTVMKLAQRVGYKPVTPEFFKLLRWKQKQSADGRRGLAIGEAVEAAETWAGLEERDICMKIMAEKPNFKRIVGLLPKEIGLTRAVMAAAIEAGSLSTSDLIILSPTLEDLGLLEVPEIKARWDAAMKSAQDQRAAHIAQRMKKKENAEALDDAADTAAKKAIEEVVRGMRIYFAVDISGSMHGSIEAAKAYLAKFIQGFPLDKITVAVFNTNAREVVIPHASAAGVMKAFQGFRAGGGTSHSAPIRTVFSKPENRPAPDEDVLMFWVGDQQEGGDCAKWIQDSGLNPSAFGMLHIGQRGGYHGLHVEQTAARLDIPCFSIDQNMFVDDDPYAITRTIRNLVAATPVRGAGVQQARVRRFALVEQILNTPLLTKPAWA